METRLVRCPSCGVTNRVPFEKVQAGLRPVCGQCKAPMPFNRRAGDGHRRDDRG